MKKTIAITILALMIFQLPAQKIVNYDKNGGKLKTVSEFVELSINNTPSNKAPLAVSATAGVVLGPVFDFAAGLIKSKIEKRKKSFVASYSNSNEFIQDDFKTGNLKELVVRRYAMNALNELEGENKSLMSEYIFKMSDDHGDLVLELKNVTLNRSKARYKESDNLAIAINIKAKASVSGSAKAEKGKSEEKKAVEGEGKILIPVISIIDGTQDFSNKGNIVGKVKIKGVKFEDLIDVIFEVSISETNITRLDPNIVEEIITNNSKDIQAILKALFKVEDE